VIRVGGAVVLSDIGEQNIPFLYKALDKALAKTGSREIEAIILSHAHDDHVKNAALLLGSRKYTVKRVLLSRNAHWSATDANRAVMRAIRRHRVPLRYVRTGQVFHFGGARWTILNPTRGAFLKHHQVSNSSIAYALEVAGKRFLFTGDIEMAGERAVVSEWQRLELGSADVLLATHHGSKFASHDFFLDAVKPKSAVISVNRGHGHPDPEAIQRLRKAGTAIWCTAWNGTVTATVPVGAGKVRLRSSENSAPWWLRGERRSRGACVDQSP
jgi:competence protein ComEC